MVWKIAVRFSNAIVLFMLLTNITIVPMAIIFQLCVFFFVATNKCRIYPYKWKRLMMSTVFKHNFIYRIFDFKLFFFYLKINLWIMLNRHSYWIVDSNSQTQIFNVDQQVKRKHLLAPCATWQMSHIWPLAFRKAIRLLTGLQNLDLHCHCLILQI